MRKIKLVIIDPNNDFVLPDGNLPVPGAVDGSKNIAKLIDRAGHKFDIDVTLDSHHYLHIAHKEWFKDKDGNFVQPFTLLRKDGKQIVSYDPVTTDVTGEFSCAIPGQEQWTLDYLDKLDVYPHCIWPTHCVIGTLGHNIYGEIEESLKKWCYKEKAVVNYLTKGSNPRTEHFSAVKAQVPDPNDPTTQINSDFINSLQECDELAFSGFALNFCLANTMLDILDIAGPDLISKCVLLEDCTGEIPGFEHLTENFMKKMKAAGMQIVKSTDYL